MKDYDRLQSVWLPLVMYFHAPNQTLDSVSTDSFGFRISSGPDGETVSVDTARSEPINLVVGNSSAFGVGASSDRTTLASALARVTGQKWMNFSGRSFAMTQELTLFQLFLGDMQRIRRIVLFSGVNDLVLHYRSPHYPDHFGSFFFWRTYHEAMTEANLSPRRRLLKRVLSPLFRDRIDYGRIPFSRLPQALLGRVPPPRPEWPGAATERNEHDVVAQVGRTLAAWAALCRGLDIDLTFVLQPLARWAAKAPSPEETELLAHYDAQPQKFYQVLSRTLDQEVHHRYSTAVAETCRHLGIGFLDGSSAFGPALDRQWTFIDPIHLSDAGTEIMARHIAAAR